MAVRRNLMVVVLCLFSTTAHGERALLKDVAATAELSSEIAQLIAAGNVKEAYLRLKPYWPVPGHEIDALIYQTESQRPAIESRFGKSLSMERAGTQVLGDSFVRYVFLEKYERHAIVWIFTFYRPGESWVVNSAAFTDDFSAMFEWLPDAPGSPGAVPRRSTAGSQAALPPIRALASSSAQ